MWKCGNMENVKMVFSSSTQTYLPHFFNSEIYSNKEKLNANVIL